MSSNCRWNCLILKPVLEAFRQGITFAAIFKFLIYNHLIPNKLFKGALLKEMIYVFRVLIAEVAKTRTFPSYGLKGIPSKIFSFHCEPDKKFNF
jgi:hypothetical protein